jgi:II/X family phage/plasmid replication protein
MGATPNQQILKDGGKKARVHSKAIDPGSGMATLIEVQCCPPLVLQKHNLFGHKDLLRYAYEVMDLLTKRLSVEVDPFDREEWRRGGIGLTEIHLTANFACSRNDVLPIIQAIDENNSQGKHRDRKTCVTLGFSEERRSTIRTLTVYDKMLELKKKWKKPGPYQLRLIAEAAKGIRVEAKFYSQGLRNRELQFVSRWKDINVEELFFECIEEFKLCYAIQGLLTEDEMGMLSNAERKAYQLWLHGIAIEDQFKRTTAWKHAKKILEKTGVDVRGNRRPEALPKIDLASIFVPENLLPVPDWAKGTEYYFAPEQTRLRSPGIMGIPVPPDVVDEEIMLDGEPYII